MTSIFTGSFFKPESIFTYFHSAIPFADKIFDNKTLSMDFVLIYYSVRQTKFFYLSNEYVDKISETVR